MTVPAQSTADNYFPIVRVVLDGCLLGSVEFKLSCKSKAEPVAYDPALQGIRARQYRHVFFSRGVDVRVIADRTTPCERKSGLGPLAEAGVPIWIDHSVRIAHAKSMVIDSQVTLTGSMNWTGSAAQNSENINLVASKIIAAAYAGHWHQRLA